MTAREADSRTAECAAFERLSLSEPTRAVAEADALLARMRAAGDAANFAYASRSLVNALPHVGEPRLAIRRAADARRFARMRAPVEAARILIAVMHPRAKLGNLKGAMRAGEQAAREFTALGETALVARAELNLANVAKALGRPARAIELIGRVLAQGEAIAPIRGQALNVLGEAFVQSADLAGARLAFGEALAVLTAQGHGFASAVVAGNLADTAARAGDIEDALRGFRDARARFASLGAHAEACRNALEEAVLLEFAGLPCDARDRAEDAGLVAERHALAAECAAARLVAGRALAATGDLRAARGALEDASRRFRSLGDALATSQALTALARCGAALGDAQAAAHAKSALEAARGAAAPIEAALAAAACVHAAPATAEARGWADESLASARATGIGAIEAEAHAAHARALRHAGSIAAAVAAAREGVARVARSHAEIALPRMRRAYLSRRGDIVAEAVHALARDGSPEALREAFDTLDRARGLAIIEALQRRSRRAHDRVREAMRGVAAQGASEASIARAARADRDASRAELEHELTDGPEAARVDPLDGELANGLAALRGDARFDATPAAPSVAFFEHENRILALVRRPDGITLCRTVADDRSSFDDACAELAFEIARGLRVVAPGVRMVRAARSACDRLASLVFLPIADAIDAGTVVVLPSRSFARLPLAALAPDAFGVAVAPSVGVARMLDAPSAGSGGGSALVVGVSDGHTAGIDREAAEVHAILARRGSVKSLVNGEATVAAVAAALPRASRAHIACHGIFPAGAPNLAGLLLGDGWFTAHDAQSLPAAPEEIVLSGCVTGASAAHDGEEWFGLVRSFAAVGTRRVIASLWPVHDEATAGLMRDMHAAGDTAARALVRCMRARLADGAHPASAAAFGVFAGARAFAPQGGEAVATDS